MALLIDTNIILDWLLIRRPFAEPARHVIKLCIGGIFQGYLAAHTILNIFYILRKEKSIAERTEILLMLCNYFEIINIEKLMMVSVLENDDLQDLEDGLQIQCAKDANLDYIITRNIKDFTKSSIKALLPEEFLKISGLLQTHQNKENT
jgi:predicted nucleic acid-binding protein